MMDPEVLRREILEEIVEVFQHRPVPETCAKAPLGDIMDEKSAKRIIQNQILGKQWTMIAADDLEFAILYMSTEAICYYMPAVLTASLIKGEATWWLPLEHDGSFGFRSTEHIRELLTIPERLIIAKYIAFFVKYLGHYTDQDYAFWRYSETHGIPPS